MLISALLLHAIVCSMYASGVIAVMRCREWTVAPSPCRHACQISLSIGHSKVNDSMTRLHSFPRMFHHICSSNQPAGDEADLTWYPSWVAVAA